MIEQPLDTRRVLRALRRGKWVVAASVIVGMAAAAALTLTSPPRYSAHALVLLSPPGPDIAGVPTRSINTEVQIATSADVLAIAAEDLRPVADVVDLKKDVTATSRTPDILEITGKGDTASRAIDVANATAEAYRVYKADSASELSESVVSELRARAEQLETQITDIQTQLNQASTELATLEPISAAAIAQTSLIDSLRIQQNRATTQLNDVQTQITQAQLASDADSAGIKLLERASTAGDSATRTMALHLGFGAIAGIIVGCTLVIARDSRDRRLRRRDDIALAAGAPVIASLATHRGRTAADWRALLLHYEPSADESWSLRRLLRGLLAVDGSQSAQLTIVTLPYDEAAVAIAPQIAAFAARTGVRTVLGVVGRDPSSASLQQTCRDAANTSEPTQPNLWITDGMPHEDAARVAAQLIVTASVADHPALDPASEHPSITLLGVSAGAATPERIAAAAAAVSDLYQPLAGVVVANPEADDGTSGRVEDRSRPRLPRLPKRHQRARDSAS